MGDGVVIKVLTNCFSDHKTQSCFGEDCKSICRPKDGVNKRSCNGRVKSVDRRDSSKISELLK